MRLPSGPSRLIVIITAGLLAALARPAGASVVTYQFTGVADPPNTPYFSVQGSFSYDSANLQTHDGITYMDSSYFTNFHFTFNTPIGAEGGPLTSATQITVDPTTFVPTGTAPYPNGIGVNIGGANNSIAMLGNSGQVFVLDYFQVGSFIVGHGNWTESGFNQANPLLPSEVNNGVYMFNNVTSGQWFDPLNASGFDYTMTTPGDYFTEIAGLPTGFGPLTVTVNGHVLGTNFIAGDQINFADYGLTNVTDFKVTGINPLVDASNTSAFPVLIDFSQHTGSFTMTPLAGVATPEPATFSLLSLGIATLGLLHIRNRSVVGDSANGVRR